MVYELIFDKNALDKLSKLPFMIKKRIINKLLITKENPFYYFQKLSNRTEYKLRVGEYRVIADINNKSKIISILYINHRRNIYKRL